MPIRTAVRGTLDLTGGEYTGGEYEAVVAELNALHEARDWTVEHQQKYRELCALERALRRRRKAAQPVRTA